MLYTLWLAVTAAAAVAFLHSWFTTQRREVLKAAASRRLRASKATGRAKKFRASQFAAVPATATDDSTKGSSFDAIVIGSGVGGLTAASLLLQYDPARFKKVAVLEQHEVPGGTLHTFTVDGAEFDTGVHYIGSGIGPVGLNTVGPIDCSRSDTGRLLAVVLDEPLGARERAVRACEEDKAEAERVQLAEEAGGTTTKKKDKLPLLVDPNALQRWQRQGKYHDIVTLRVSENSDSAPNTENASDEASIHHSVSKSAGRQDALARGLDAAKWRVFPAGTSRMDDLRSEFPEQAAAITELEQKLREAGRAGFAWILAKVFPWLHALAPLLPRVWPSWRLWEHYGPRTLATVLDDCAITDPLLRRALSYILGDYGTLPNDSSFFVHASVERHYKLGGFFPAGGSAALASRLVAAVQRAGGEVYTSASVSEIVCQELAPGKFGVRGVRVREQKFVQATAGLGARPNFDANLSETEDSGVLLTAPTVISSAGVFTTFRYLLPKRVRESAVQEVTGLLAKQVPGISPASATAPFRPSGCHLQMFVVLDKEAEVTSSNHWIYYDTSKDFENCGNQQGTSWFRGGLFVSFPPGKDADYQRRCPDRKAMIVVTETDVEMFDRYVRGHERWRRYHALSAQEGSSEEHSRESLRTEYEALKKKIGDEMLHRVLEHFPHLKSHVLRVEVGTPMAANQYYGREFGDSYGMAHTSQRFDPHSDDAASLSRVSVNNVSGLYLSGQEVCTAGIAGALHGGMVAACYISKKALVSVAPKMKPAP